MLNSSRKPGATRKAESYLSILCENLLAKSDFLASRKVRVYEYDRFQFVKKRLSRINGCCYIKLPCSPMYFFSRNRCPYRGVNLPGFLRETRTRICIHIFITNCGSRKTPDMASVPSCCSLAIKQEVWLQLNPYQPIIELGRGHWAPRPWRARLQGRRRSLGLDLSSAALRKAGTGFFLANLGCI